MSSSGSETLIARAPAGWLAAVWKLEGSPVRLGTSVSSDAGTTWSPPVYLDVPDAFHPVIVASGSSVIDLAWLEGEWIRHARSVDGGRSFSAPARIMTTDVSRDRAFDMAVSSEGAIAVMSIRPPEAPQAVVTVSRVMSHAQPARSASLSAASARFPPASAVSDATSGYIVSTTYGAL